MRCFIDTDPGLDDALAILAALGPEGPETAGLCAVAGNVDLGQAARNAAALIALAGTGTPLALGAEEPLRGPRRHEARHVHGTDGVGGVTLPEAPLAARPDAVAFLADSLAAGGPARLLCLGPLTNIARLIAEKPAARRRIERLIVMGGAVAAPGNVGARAEFNFAADPDAADIVLRAGLPVTLIPLDATRLLRADRDFARKLAAAPGPVAAVAARLIAACFADPADALTRPLHDPCVTLFALRPDLFSARPLHVRVFTDGADPGAIETSPDPDSPVEVVHDIDAPAARALLLRLLSWSP